MFYSCLGLVLIGFYLCLIEVLLRCLRYGCYAVIWVSWLDVFTGRCYISCLVVLVACMFTFALDVWFD